MKLAHHPDERTEEVFAKANLGRACERMIKLLMEGAPPVLIAQELELINRTGGEYLTLMKQPVAGFVSLKDEDSL